MSFNREVFTFLYFLKISFDLPLLVSGFGQKIFDSVDIY